jgi:hypothetical protein
MFRATMCLSSGERTVSMRHLVFVTLCRWLCGISCQVSHEHSCFSFCWTHIRPKHVEIDKYAKKMLCTKLALFIRLCRDAWSTERKVCISTAWTNVKSDFWISEEAETSHKNISGNEWILRVIERLHSITGILLTAGIIHLYCTSPV